MINYKNMVHDARNRGIANETTMWKSIEDVSEIMGTLKEYHPEQYWHFMRKTHENLYGCHYNPEFAKYDVEQMFHTDDSGQRHEGQHWSKEEVVSAWANKVFPNGTTECDEYVGANAIYHDLCKSYSDSDILNIAYMFFFADEDAPEGKVWHYMNAMHY